MLENRPFLQHSFFRFFPISSTFQSSFRGEGGICKDGNIVYSMGSKEDRTFAYCVIFGLKWKFLIYKLAWLWLWSINIGYTKVGRLSFLKLTRFNGNFLIWRHVEWTKIGSILTDEGTWKSILAIFCDTVNPWARQPWAV